MLLDWVPTRGICTLLLSQKNVVCWLRNDTTPNDTSRKTCFSSVFLETESCFSKTSNVWLWKWITKEENAVVPGEKIGTYLHLWSGRVVEGYIMEFNFTLNSIQLVTIFWHAVNDGFLERNIWGIQQQYILDAFTIHLSLH